MPATGPRAPARTLVAVRAIVPVTTMPPNSAAPTFAAPCATSSQFERWRRPVMPSATVAESKDSMAPSKAKANASGRTAAILARLKAGSAGAGRPAGTPPKREPIVSIGKPKSAAATLAAATEIRIAGAPGAARRRPTMSAIVSAAIPAAYGLKVESASAAARAVSTAPVCAPAASVRPKRSPIWLAKMMTAMPAVKPMVTG
jgi:hypothetical protein